MTTEILHGDCIEQMTLLIERGVMVDSIVTDPPSGIGFMGKEWDHHKGGRDQWIAWMEGVAAKALILAKPGAHALVWALPKTSHWTVTAWENAGWEVRDRVSHLFGTGFPKSLDISKAIDKVAPRKGMFDSFAAHFSEKLNKSGLTQKDVSKNFPSKSGGLTGCVWNWANGVNVPTREQWIILQPMLGLSDEWCILIDRVQAEREVIGKHPNPAANKAGGNSLNMSVVGMPDSSVITKASTPEAQQWEGWGTALKPAMEDWWLLRKPLSEATVAANVLKHGVGGLNIDACRIEGVKRVPGGIGSDVRPAGKNQWRMGVPTDEMTGRNENIGRFPSHLIHDGSEEVMEAFADCGADTAARFFYSAKANKSDRFDSKHPTVKSIALLRYLCKLITPPGGVILDMFAGSGTTLAAAHAEGFGSIGIEKEDEYIDDIHRRVAFYEKLPVSELLL